MDQLGLTDAMARVDQTFTRVVIPVMVRVFDRIGEQNARVDRDHIDRGYVKGPFVSELLGDHVTEVWNRYLRGEIHTAQAPDPVGWVMREVTGVMSALGLCPVDHLGPAGWAGFPGMRASLTRPDPRWAELIRQTADKCRALTAEAVEDYFDRGPSGPPP